MFCNDRSVWHGKATTQENVSVAHDTFRLTLLINHQSQDRFPQVQPGQFVMLRLADRADPLLGRPLAIYRGVTSENTTLLEVVYLVVGKMTARLAQVRSGDTLNIWGPLGNGFNYAQDEQTIMVAGGIGQTPFLMLAEQLKVRTLLYGARSADRIAGLNDFRKLGVDVRIATDDGSLGYCGPITDLIADAIVPGQTTKIICCGPKPMLKAAFQVARKRGIPCDVSLENPMGCGLGICFGCVVPYRDSSSPTASIDYKRTCIDGPAFDAYRLLWD